MLATDNFNNFNENFNFKDLTHLNDSICTRDWEEKNLGDIIFHVKNINLYF